MPLRAASIRKLKPAASRRCLTARPVRRLTSSSKVDNMSSIVHERAVQARSMDKADAQSDFATVTSNTCAVRSWNPRSA